MNVTIRQEQEKDFKQVYHVIFSAFEKEEYSDHTEQDLVVKLRTSDAFIPQLSLVAEVDGTVVGHILFTKLTVGNEQVLALAPLSVLPSMQRQGIGSALIKEGHRIGRELGFKGSIVLGHPHYYKKFGYENASKYKIECPFPVEDDIFMAKELVPNGLNNVKGMAIYAKEFNLL